MLAEEDARHQTEAEGNEHLRGKAGHSKAFAPRCLGVLTKSLGVLIMRSNG